MTTRIAPLQPPHTCIDRPHLPCDACEIRAEKHTTSLDRFSKELIRTAFRLGYRAAVIKIAAWHPCPDTQIDAEGRELLGEEYYQ